MHGAVGLLSIALFSAVWKAGHTLISPCLIPNAYSRFSEKDKLDWNSRYVQHETEDFITALQHALRRRGQLCRYGSTFHAILVVIYAANVLFFTDAFQDTFMAKVWASKNYSNLSEHDS